jgi:hypothetical protein
LVHAGDVLDLNGQGQFVVVRAVAEDKSGYLVIDVVSADDELGQWRYPPKGLTGRLRSPGPGVRADP